MLVAAQATARPFVDKKSVWCRWVWSESEEEEGAGVEGRVGEGLRMRMLEG